MMSSRSIAARPAGQPWTDPRFWILQLIVLAIYLVRLALTLALNLDTGSLGLELSTFVLFLVPVVVAALSYGLGGALATAGWVTILAIPRVASAAASHDAQAAWLEVVQVWLLDVLAGLIGQRVSSERAARELVDTERKAHLRAEALYRDLFESNEAPILIVDSNGGVVETNAAATRAFGRVGESSDGRPPGAEPRRRLVDVIGANAAALVLGRLVGGQHRSDESPGADRALDEVEPVEVEVAGRPVLYRPTATMLSGPIATRQMQVVFEDVTAETRRREGLEAYAARVVTGQEDERRRIAHELHDGPVQTLIHLCRQIDEVESRVSADCGSPALSDLRATVEETVAELRSIATGLRPPILDDLGLVASINQMVTESAARGRFEASFGVTGTATRLSPTVELALFRIAQEALSNIERHASAQRVAVGLDFESGGLRMLVKDDGLGFETDAGHGAERNSSLGVAGMTERAHLIGSRLRIHSSPGSGTTVDVSVPATMMRVQ